ncbi:MAG TPA: FAD-dependent oxidoreductase [Micromonosporaceae bacterium]
MRLGIIGLGAAGLAAALGAARDGHDVVGFEQSGLDNQEASSGGRGKVIRFGYTDPFYADLMRSTMDTWERLAERTSARLMDRNGGLHIGPSEVVDVIEQGIRKAGRPAERTTDGSAFGIRLDDADQAVYEPDAGVMWPSAVRGALAAEAAAAGATLRDHVQVEALDETGDGVAVRTGNGVEIFDRLILSGGPWAFRLAPAAAKSFLVSRRFQLVWGTDGPIGDGLPRPWIDMAGSTVYGMINASSGIHLMGLHDLDQGQTVTDPDEPDDADFRATSIERQAEYVRRRFGIEPRPIDIRVCHYTMTASEDFVIDDCPGFDRVTLLSPCSGHGFKFSVTTGLYAAAVATGRPIPDRERFRLQFATMS